jgi:hypothetical protein
MTFSARPRPTWGRPTCKLLVMTCLTLPLLSSTAEAAPARHIGQTAHRNSAKGRSRSTHAISTRTFPRNLRQAARRSRRADRTLVSDARRLKRCRTEHPRHPKRCNAARGAVQRAGTKLARAEQSLARIARGNGRAGKGAGPSASGNPRQAPQLTVSGQTLRWTRVSNINTYVLVSKVPGKTAMYSVVSGTAVTPPPVPGMTVRYSVRTTANGSAWSTEQSITYPAATGADTQAAPALTVSGQTLEWTKVANVTTYVLVSTAKGQAPQYSEVSGNSITPAAVPGATVSYSVRTAVEGSAWSPEVKISYPSGAKPGSSEPPAPTQGGGPFEMGIVSGSDALYELPFIKQLGAHTARVEEWIGEPASQLESTIAAFAQDGVRVLLLASFSGEMPTAGQAQNLAGWAARFGPGGSFWQGKTEPAGTAVTDIEFGNETSYEYQYSDNSPSAYASRAQTYALRFAEAATAIRSAAPNVGLLAQGDSGNNGPEWAKQMFKAVPNLGQLVAGWTVHPYGPKWQSQIDNLISTTQADGAPSSVPIYITEWGLDSDNGRCLEYNFGWNKCMTYSEAASTLGSAVAAMRARYGSRLAAFYLYQAHDQAATGTSTSLESYFGALQSNASPKGAYTSEVESLLATNP